MTPNPYVLNSEEVHPSGSAGTDHIGVCIPTFKRPQMLAQLLVAVRDQKSDGMFSHSIHVIDNDPMRSAEETVSAFARDSAIAITYEVEPVQNIALARNRALRCAHGDLVAFIDDDECPTDEWLLRLFLAYKKYQADGILGPVRPRFGTDAPLWLKKSGLCERPSHASGTILNDSQTRTGNVLFRRSILDGIEVPFPPEKGRTGGEDMAFFRAMMTRGRVFAWCEEAPVYEQVPPERYDEKFYIDRSLRIGGLTGEMLRNKSLGGRWSAAAKSTLALIAHSLGIVAGRLFGRHVRVRHSVKSAYHLGRLCGSFGFVPIRYRNEV